MNWVPKDPHLGPKTFHVAYTRPGGDMTRVGPLQEDYARAMAQEYHRKGIKDVSLEEWAPVRTWSLA